MHCMTSPFTPNSPKHSPLGIAKLIPRTAVLLGDTLHPERRPP